MEGNDEDESTSNFAIRVLCPMLGDLQGVQEDNVLVDARNGSSSCKTWRYFDIKGCYFGWNRSRYINKCF